MGPVHIHQRRRSTTIEFHSRAVERVIDAVQDRLDEEISLSHMAEIAYMSPYHFNRVFRQVTGLTPCRFLNALRLRAAMQMLLHTDNRVTDICLDVGYNSLGTFIRRFSGLLGMSPLRLRRLRGSTNNLLQLARWSDESAASSTVQRSVFGRIDAPLLFSGPIFVGLFPASIPEGVPVACTFFSQPGAFSMTSPPCGSYYVFALGLPWPSSVDDYFNVESILRGGGEIISIGEEVVECSDISLRPALPTDPPILLNLPFLLKNRASHLNWKASLPRRCEITNATCAAQHTDDVP